MKALLGMILDSYGRYLHDINDGKTALKVTLEALDICQELFGETDSRVNNIGHTEIDIIARLH